MSALDLDQRLRSVVHPDVSYQNRMVVWVLALALERIYHVCWTYDSYVVVQELLCLVNRDHSPRWDPFDRASSVCVVQSVHVLA